MGETRSWWPSLLGQETGGIHLPSAPVFLDLSRSSFKQSDRCAGTEARSREGMACGVAWTAEAVASPCTHWSGCCPPLPRSLCVSLASLRLREGEVRGTKAVVRRAVELPVRQRLNRWVAVDPGGSAVGGPVAEPVHTLRGVK